MIKTNKESDIHLAIGLMSGTSLDGVDVAVIASDGQKAIQFGPNATYGYEDDFRARLRSVLGGGGLDDPKLESIESELTDIHARAVMDFMATSNLSADEIDLIGFHGHTVFHDPGAKITRQIGNGQQLADATSISVVCDFRTNDVATGGEGAPLVPVYHQALIHGTPKIEPPVAVVNLGGIANVTWIGENEDDLLAFDTGPCNALLDDWVFEKTGANFDDGGKIALSGSADETIVTEMLNHPYFSKPNPKSLDRLDFNISAVKNLSCEDGAATLVSFIADAIKKSQSTFPAEPTCWILTGGGRHNNALVGALKNVLNGEVKISEDLGWNGDALEAQAFAYLAVRSVKELPISFPMTTGVDQPTCGGKLFDPK